MAKKKDAPKPVKEQPAKKTKTQPQDKKPSKNDQGAEANTAPAKKQSRTKKATIQAEPEEKEDATAKTQKRARAEKQEMERWTFLTSAFRYSEGTINAFEAAFRKQKPAPIPLTKLTEEDLEKQKQEAETQSARVYWRYINQIQAKEPEAPPATPAPPLPAHSILLKDGLFRLDRIPYLVALGPLIIQEVMSLPTAVLDLVVEYTQDPERNQDVQFRLFVNITVLEQMVAAGTLSDYALDCVLAGVRLACPESRVLPRMSKYSRSKHPTVALDAADAALCGSLLRFPLFDYQRSTVAWMKQREQIVSYAVPTSLGSGDEVWPGVPSLRVDHLNRALWCHDGKGKAAKTMEGRQLSCQGGILADEVGLGKTLAVIALILLNTRPVSFSKAEFLESTTDAEPSRIQVNATLLVCPSHLAQQWESEVLKFCQVPLKIVTLVTAKDHSQVTYQQLLQADLVIVSVAFLMNTAYSQRAVKKKTVSRGNNLHTHMQQLRRDPDWLQKPYVMLELCHWCRLVADEAHELFGSTSKRLVQEILELTPSLFRWYVSGTPFPDGLCAVRGALRFLNLRLNDQLLFREELEDARILAQLKKERRYVDLDDLEDTDYPVDSTVLQSLLLTPTGHLIDQFLYSHLFVRHTQKSVGATFSVPDVDHELILCELTPFERCLYDLVQPGSNYDVQRLQFCAHALVATTYRHILGVDLLSQDEMRASVLVYYARLYAKLRRRWIKMKADVDLRQDRGAANFNAMVRVLDSISLTGEEATKLMRTFMSFRAVATVLPPAPPKRLPGALALHFRESWFIHYDYGDSLAQDPVEARPGIACGRCSMELDLMDLPMLPCAHLLCNSCILQIFCQGPTQGRAGVCSLCCDQQNHRHRRRVTLDELIYLGPDTGRAVLKAKYALWQAQPQPQGEIWDRYLDCPTCEEVSDPARAKMEECKRTRGRLRLKDVISCASCHHKHQYTQLCDPPPEWETYLAEYEAQKDQRNTGWRTHSAPPRSAPAESKFESAQAPQPAQPVQPADPVQAAQTQEPAAAIAEQDGSKPLVSQGDVTLSSEHGKKQSPEVMRADPNVPQPTQDKTKELQLGEEEVTVAEERPPSLVRTRSWTSMSPEERAATAAQYTPPIKRTLRRPRLVTLRRQQVPLSLVNELGGKLAQLVHFVKTMSQNPAHRFLLFSQWESMLSYAAVGLEQHGIGCVICQGNVMRRNKAIREFEEGKEAKVMLLSLSHAAAGTNLQTASHVILLDAMGSALEEVQAQESQAIARAHRQGQAKRLMVTRFVVMNTLEWQLHCRNQKLNPAEANSILSTQAELST